MNQPGQPLHRRLSRYFGGFPLFSALVETIALAIHFQDMDMVGDSGVRGRVCSGPENGAPGYGKHLQGARSVVSKAVIDRAFEVLTVRQVAKAVGCDRRSVMAVRDNGRMTKTVIGRTIAQAIAAMSGVPVAVIVPPAVLPVPREKFVEPVLWRPSDPGEKIGEPSLRIDFVELGGANEGKGRCARALDEEESSAPSAVADKKSHAFPRLELGTSWENYSDY